MYNPLDNFTTAEKKEILTAGPTHPRHAELKAAYVVDDQIIAEWISQCEDREYARLDRLGVQC